MTNDLRDTAGMISIAPDRQQTPASVIPRTPARDKAR
jgi:hypothetical protein